MEQRELAAHDSSITEMTAEQRAWRRIGWDGILLQVPSDWHPAAVYTDYLLFEEHYQPVFALKWQQVKGRFEADSILKQLQKSPGRPELTPWQPPSDWRPHLRPFIHQGFSWQSSDGRGTGLLLYCRDSRRALLLQFYGEEKSRLSVFRQLLANLQARQRGKYQLWSVFDLSLELPENAQLTEHEFLPGSFRLLFSLPEGTLTFYRFKPAAELLRRQSLREFGSKIADGASVEQIDNPLLAQWRKHPGPGRHLLARLRRKPAFSTVRLWLLPEKNVIFGLKAQGDKPMAPAHFEALCNSCSPC